jgi:hypothetical protein
MNDIDEVTREVWGMVGMMVRSHSAPTMETGVQDKDGAMIRTGDVLELWMDDVGGFHGAEPGDDFTAVREVLVVHERDGKFYGVDYDILKGIDLTDFAAYSTIRGSAFTDEGLEYLRMGLMRFNGETPPPGKPEFVDAQAMAQAHPTTFDAPSAEELAGIKPGCHVKVNTGGEKFWILVTSHNPPDIVGTIANELLFTGDHGLSEGDEITVEERHVHMILPEGEP